MKQDIKTPPMLSNLSVGYPELQNHKEHSPKSSWVCHSFHTLGLRTFWEAANSWSWYNVLGKLSLIPWILALTHSQYSTSKAYTWFGVTMAGNNVCLCLHRGCPKATCGNSAARDPKAKTALHFSAISHSSTCPLYDINFSAYSWLSSSLYFFILLKSLSSSLRSWSVKKHLFRLFSFCLHLQLL